MNGVIFLTTTSRDGDARNPAALTGILKARHIPNRLATAEQVHGSKVVIASDLDRPRRFYGADALLTSEVNQPLGVFTADCVPVFLCAPRQGGIGLCHAGWRGLQAGIVLKTVSAAEKGWGCRPRDMHLWVGPHIGRCCFEVQWQTARYFPAARYQRDGRWYVDLAQAVKRQAHRAGLLARRIRCQAPCTHHEARFFSYRRDQTAMRQISIIMRQSRKTRSQHGLA